MLTDMEIIKQLWSGNHLNEQELNEATNIIRVLKVTLEQRFKYKEVE